MKVNQEQAGFALGMAGAALLLTLKFPNAGAQMFASLAARAKATKEGKHADDDFLGQCGFSVQDGQGRQSGSAKHDQNQGTAADELTVRHATLNKLHFFNVRRIGGFPSANQRLKVLHMGTDGREDFFVVGDHNFMFLVRDTFLGRFTARVLLAFVHGYLRCFVSGHRTEGAAA